MKELDKKDLAILRLLLQDGRISHVAVGEAIGLSNAAVAGRVKKLEESGYIAGYHADIRTEKLGLGYTALLLVQLSQHGKGRLEAFERVLEKQCQYVLNCHRLDGSWDYCLVVMATDKTHFDTIRNEIRELEHVERLRTYPARTIFTALPPLPEDTI